MEKRIKIMIPLLNEKQKRIYLASEAISYGKHGVKKVSEISGVSVNTIKKGIKEIENGNADNSDNRIRCAGGGRKKVTVHHPEILQNILEIIDGKTYGNPEKILSYTTLSLKKIQKILFEKYAIEISFRTISDLLEELGYSKQSNQKMLQNGTPHPDRNEQFEFINNKTNEFLKEGLPVISVDTKKKEIIGNFKNNGTEYRKIKDPRKVLDHDFPISELGKVAPYGVYVLNNNTGFINLGTSHDTSEFAVESITRWWEIIGRENFPNADKIYINCDNGGSNGSRLHLWKYELQLFANVTGLEVHISHFPPGTSKWNKIEHRLFCYISKSWQGQPLIDIETVVNLISNTTTSTGLIVNCCVDTSEYKTGISVSDDDYRMTNIFDCDTLNCWNYIIKPNSSTPF